MMNLGSLMHDHRRYMLMSTKLATPLLCMGSCGNQYGGSGHDVTKGGKDPEQDSPFAEDKLCNFAWCPTR